jgi:hypothetical protein
VLTFSSRRSSSNVAPVSSPTPHRHSRVLPTLPQHEVPSSTQQKTRLLLSSHSIPPSPFLSLSRGAAYTRTPSQPLSIVPSRSHITVPSRSDIYPFPFAICSPSSSSFRFAPSLSPLVLVVHCITFFLFLFPYSRFAGNVQRVSIAIVVFFESLFSRSFLLPPISLPPSKNLCLSSSPSSSSSSSPPRCALLDLLAQHRLYSSRRGERKGWKLLRFVPSCISPCPLSDVLNGAP